jgi:hypothetical protein
MRFNITTHETPKRNFPMGGKHTLGGAAGEPPHSMSRDYAQSRAAPSAEFRLGKPLPLSPLRGRSGALLNTPLACTGWRRSAPVLFKLSCLPVMLRGRNGIYIVKCQDEICGGKSCPTHIELVLEFAKLGFELEDPNLFRIA